jgi:membrane protein implicated in regulation of membrane protease activity
MAQTRTKSALEAIANVAFGLVVAFLANLVILPLVGLPVSLSQASWISAAFTLVSLVRSYALRRFFNLLDQKKGP